MGALQIVSSRDKMYFNGGGRSVLVYDSFTDCWTTLSPDFKGGQVFANEEEIYILSDGGEGQCFQCYFQLLDGNRFPSCGKRHVGPIEKYKPKSNSWEHVALFDMGPNNRHGYLHCGYR